MKRTPTYAEVLVRDPRTLEIVPDGAVGLLEFVCPLPHSYPGVAVLLDDMGRIVSRDPGGDGWQGTGFEIVGRAERAEMRGCGDTLPGQIYESLAGRFLSAMKFHLLFDHEGPRIGLDDGHETAPVLDGLEPLVAARLRAGQQRLRAVAFDDLLGLCDAAARSWTQPGHPLADFIRRNRSRLPAPVAAAGQSSDACPALAARPARGARPLRSAGRRRTR